ncbi:MAG: hypothetical protein JWN32_2012 [Solirubrobacterales bacterium]|nr:hypothetical protein [Solirubrobacterales bacterium]
MLLTQEGKNRMERRWPSWRPVALLLVAVAVVTGGAIGLASSGSSPGRAKSAPTWARGGEVPNAQHERANEAKNARQAKFERGKGKEGSRTGPTTPAAEQVGNRAYPRSYVDDKLAIQGGQDFRNLPSGPTATRTRAGTRATTFTQPWNELGPFTPNVAGPDSQFFDPATLTGPSTQESGRVTALAIDPACVAGNCKMWVAAAGGGIWRTNDALAAHPTWTPPPASLPTNAFGSIYYDAAHDVLYAGSGEPNGSGDSEAGLGLFRSTDGGASWSLVPGSDAVATNRSIGAIAIDPSDATGHTIYIGTDVARHGSAAVNGGRFTPPNAPTLGVYKSTDNGTSFTLEADLSNHTPPNPAASSSGVDWFQGGINKLLFDPNAPHVLYAGVVGYGVWRADQTAASPAWEQVFHTMNQNLFDPTKPHEPQGDSTGDRTEFDFASVGGHTRVFLGDASDDWATDGDATTPLPQVWRVDSIDTKAASTLVDNAGTDPATLNPGWTLLSSEDPTSKGFAASGFCQNGQCGYDEFVAHPPGADANTVWLGGSMNYDELPAYDQFGTGAPPRSNGRAVIRSTDANGATANDVSWHDMTMQFGDPTKAWDPISGVHPDLHAIAFANNGNVAFIGSDGGIARIDASAPQDKSGSCDHRQYVYDSTAPDTKTPLAADDLALCKELLNGTPSAVTPLNDGLRTLQFQSLSFNPANPTGDLLGGTQDNGTWNYTGSPAWTESVGGDGGQSGFDAGSPNAISYHNYYDATPEVNFHGNDPTKWLDVYDPLQVSPENRSFYTPFAADPSVAGRAYTGMESVWRTDDNGGNEQDLVKNHCYAYDLDPFRTKPCGDWFPIGDNLTSNVFKGDRTGQFVVAVERTKSNPGTLWAATRTGRVFITKNADADRPKDVQFYRLDSSKTPGRFVSGIAVDPNDSNHAWVSYSGFDAYTPDTPGHVFDVRYDPSSHHATFTDLSKNLGDQPVTGIAENGATGDVFAATDFGVAELPAGGAQWISAGTGLPTASVFGLTVSQDAHVLYAATHGRGAWSMKLPVRPTGAITGPAQLERGKSATFTGTGSTPNGGGVTFSWSLPGVPSSATGATATFVPTKLGAQAIVLTVTDSFGISTTVTKAVKVVDTGKPAVALRKIKTVRLGKTTVIRGVVVDPSGIKAVKITFGDRKSAKPKLGARGAFTIKHKYKKAKTYKVTLTVTHNTGPSTKATAKAKVLKKKH